jgi:hypothetical protein
VPDSEEHRRPERVVEYLAGDCTVLCAVVATRGRVVIVVNSVYPDALAHAEAHLNGAGMGVWVCRPECSHA